MKKKKILNLFIGSNNKGKIKEILRKYEGNMKEVQRKYKGNTKEI